MPELNLRTVPLEEGGQLRLETRVGAKLTACRVHELKPGQWLASRGREEWLVVVAGAPTLHARDGQEPLRPGDVVRLTHEVRNDTADPVRILLAEAR